MKPKSVIGSALATLLAVIFLVAAVLFVVNGPGKIKNSFTSWSANWGGNTPWLIVQYTVSGEVMNSWEIKGSIQHESHGDGVYFTTDHGIVHLTGHFIYVQDPTDEARRLYPKKK